MRLYLTSSSHPDSSLVIAGQASGWLNTMGDVKSHLSPVKSGANTAYTAVDNVSTNPAQYMMRRFVSSKFERDGNFNPGTISYAFARQESNTAANMTFRIIIVVHNASGVARAIVGTWTSTTEFPTTLTAATGTLSGGNTVAVTAGEYLSIEFGFAAANSVTTSYTGTIRAGGTDATDLALGTTGVTTRSPWFDFPTAGLEDLWTPDLSQGGGVRFDSEDDGLEAFTGLPTDTWTALCWAKLKVDRNTYSTLFEPGDGTSANYNQCGAGADGTTMAAFADGQPDLAPGYSATVDAWFKFAVRRDGTGATALSCFAGPASGALLKAVGGAGSNNITQWSIGWSDAWGGEWWNGEMAAFKQWNAALTDAEIEAEFTQYRAIKTAGLAREHFMEGSALTDYSGSDNVLSLRTSMPASVAGPPGVPYRLAGPTNPDQNNHFLAA